MNDTVFALLACGAFALVGWLSATQAGQRLVWRVVAASCLAVTVLGQEVAIEVGLRFAGDTATSECLSSSGSITSRCLSPPAQPGGPQFWGGAIEFVGVPALLALAALSGLLRWPKAQRVCLVLALVAMAACWTLSAIGADQPSRLRF